MTRETKYYIYAIAILMAFLILALASTFGALPNEIL